jgi:DNA-directed RNA polymerase specialized sigma24 family protein
MGLERLLDDGIEPADFEVLCDSTYERVVKAAFLTLADREGARDVAQETFARAFARWTQVQAVENPEGWLYRVAVNLSLSWRKQAFRRVLRNPPDQHQNAYSRKRRIRHSSSVVTGRTLIAFLRSSLQPNAAHASFDVFIISAAGSDQHAVTTQGEEGFSPFNPAGLSWEPEEHATPAADESPASSAKASGASTPPVSPPTRALAYGLPFPSSGALRPCVPAPRPTFWTRTTTHAIDAEASAGSVCL